MITIYRIFLYIFFGILPALVWLFYYLSKDLHPEPRTMILKVFLWGALITIPVFFVQLEFSKILDVVLSNLGLPNLDYLLKLSLPNLGPLPLVMVLIYWFLVIAFTEEFFKYLVVRWKVFSNQNLDEPVDIMIYMIIAALGFAALENILYLFSPIDSLSLDQVLSNALILSFVRFIGATFLHTLASGAIGYFLVIEVYEIEKRGWFLFSGLFLATILHGLYNFSVMTFKGTLQIAVPVTILAGLAIFVLWAFNKVKQMKSISEI
ncbi:MAG: PrsW family intramembrane metalloprotease [Candidatus Staskawiczbacteria bacterium]|nr:PrsW family intramembrane metalloprotease [Candidatus Staskawiczbacteria bacterium]